MIDSHLIKGLARLAIQPNATAERATKTSDAWWIAATAIPTSTSLIVGPTPSTARPRIGLRLLVAVGTETGRRGEQESFTRRKIAALGEAASTRRPGLDSGRRID